MDAKTRGILALVLNILIPGVGTLIWASGITDEAAKKPVMTRGIIQLVLYVVGIITTCIVIGFVLIIGAWVWALIDGIKFFQEGQKAQESQG